MRASERRPLTVVTLDPDNGHKIGYSRVVGLDVFGAVPEPELRKAGRRRRFDRGEVVFHRDDPGDSLHRVESGRFAARIITPVGDVATVWMHGPR
jgi:Cyclic nucleotide-binding domain